MRRALAACLLLVGSATARADHVDDVVRAEMRKRAIPGLSLAIIQGGKIVKAAGYGTVDGKQPVTTRTLFQAGSISKAVTALGALRLVERGALALDEDVNARLVTWKVPDSPLTAKVKVTVREILSHTAGLTVHGFPGYAVSAPRPTLVQVLDGQPPANTEAIRVELEPGTEWRYSGGGYTVLQLLMTDVTHRPFPELMRALVLAPAGMTESSFEQPLPAGRARATASGYLADRSPVEGRWHVYPEMAAAGLWTTPSDLARFAIEVQRALAGRSRRTVSRDTARLMLTEVKNGDGLGVFLQGKGADLTFGHDGRDEGFDAFLHARAETGQGFVVMINTNDDSRMMPRIEQAIAAQYHWPQAAHAPSPSPPVAAATVDAATLAGYCGRYEFSNNNLRTLVVHDGRLFTFSGGFRDDELVPQAPDRFITSDGGTEVTFVAGGFTWRRGEEKGTAPRVGPLGEGLPARPDPDVALSAKVLAAARALATKEKGDAWRALMTEGAQKDFANAAYPELAKLDGLTFLDAQDAAGRGLERHGSKVARILLYAVQPVAKPRFLVAYLTSDGKLTDFDMVDE